MTSGPSPSEPGADQAVVPLNLYEKESGSRSPSSSITQGRKILAEPPSEATEPSGRRPALLLSLPMPN